MEVNELYSSQPLVDFGMDEDMANYLVGAMHKILETEGFGGFSSITTNRPDEYYILSKGAQKGPFSPAQLLQLVSARQVNNETYMWKPGMKSWRCAEQVPEITRLVAAGMS